MTEINSERERFEALAECSDAFAHLIVVGGHAEMIDAAL
jgi:hypothetical protein